MGDANASRIRNSSLVDGHSLTIIAEEEWEQDCVLTAGRVKVMVQGVTTGTEIGTYSVVLVNKGVNYFLNNTKREAVMIKITWKKLLNIRESRKLRISSHKRGHTESPPDLTSFGRIEKLLALEPNTSFPAVTTYLTVYIRL